LNNLCRGPLDDLTYQISKQKTLWFLTRRCFKIKQKYFSCHGNQSSSWNFNSFNNFGRASCKEHPCKVTTNLAKWFKRRSCLKKLLTHGCTDDWTMDGGQWAITKAHLEDIVPRFSLKSILIKHSNHILINFTSQVQLAYRQPALLSWSS